MTDNDSKNIHLGLLDDLDHQAKVEAHIPYVNRERELQLQALGAAISRRDWSAVELAYSVLRDAFYGR